MRSKSSRQIYNTEIVDNNFHEDPLAKTIDDNVDYGINFLVYDIASCTTDRRNPYSIMPKDNCLALNPEDKGKDAVNVGIVGRVSNEKHLLANDSY